jgi:hypothetical protein
MAHRTWHGHVRVEFVVSDLLMTGSNPANSLTEKQIETCSIEHEHNYLHNKASIVVSKATVTMA